MSVLTCCKTMPHMELSHLEVLPCTAWSRHRAPKGQSRKGLKVHTCTYQRHTAGAICGKTYTRAEHLRRHQLSHIGNVYYCPIPRCTARFVRRDLAELHFQRRHSELLPSQYAISESESGSFDHTSAEGSITDQHDDQKQWVSDTNQISTPISHLFHYRNEAEAPLMHHYLQNHESMLFPANVTSELKMSRSWWLRIGPALLDQDDSVKDIIISFACEHHLHHRHDEALENLSTLYCTRAISKFHQILRYIEQPGNGNQITALQADILLFIGFMLLPRRTIELHKLQHTKATSEQIFSTLLGQLTLSQGFHTLFEIVCGLPIFQDTHHKQLLESFSVPLPAPASPNQLPFPVPPEVPTTEPRYFTYLLTGLETSHPALEITNAYRSVLVLLDNHYGWIIGTDAYPVGQAWGVNEGKAPPLWLHLCKQHDPLAMAILAHFICLSNASKDRTERDHPPEAGTSTAYWWCSPTPSLVPWQVQAIAQLMPKEWDWAMRWPLGVATGEIDVREMPGGVGGGDGVRFQEIG